MLTEFQQAIVSAVNKLKPGEVVSFGDIAARAGRPSASRAVGNLLARVPADLPWWRVVYSDGRLPPCNPTVQADHLEQEKVTLNAFRVIQSPKGRFGKS